jgi:hypothetical protein
LELVLIANVFAIASLANAPAMNQISYLVPSSRAWSDRAMRVSACIGSLAILFVVAEGCSSRSIEKSSGRLAFAKDVSTTPRLVKQMLLFDGKVWAPSEERNLADRIGWCDASPNPKVEALRCYSDDYKSTFVILISGNSPQVKTFDEPLGSAWIDDDGKWILFHKRFFNVETREELPVNGLDGDFAIANVLLGVSPDKRTVVIGFSFGLYGPKSNPYYGLEIIDVATGTVTKKKVDWAKYAWVVPDDTAKFAPDERRAASKHVEWKKDADGKDVVAVPELVELDPVDRMSAIEKARAAASASASASVAPSASVVSSAAPR